MRMILVTDDCVAEAAMGLIHSSLGESAMKAVGEAEGVDPD